MHPRSRLPVFLFVILISALPSLCHAQEGDLQDVIYLKDGSIIRGIIIEQIPEESLKLRTAAGSVIVFQMSEIERIAKEKPQSAVQTVPRKSRKDPVVAGLLSFFLPGTGQLYNGEMAKGAIMFGVASIGSLLIFSAAYDEVHGDEGVESKAVPGLFIVMGAWIWSTIDAPISASRINRENGWTSLPILNDSFALSLADFSIDGKTTPGLALTWSF